MAGFLHEQHALRVALTGVGCVALLLVIVIVMFIRRRRLKRTSMEMVDQPTICISELPETGPEEGGAVLTYYGAPVRVAVVLLAPSGRQSVLPPSEELPKLMEEIVPGFAKVVTRDRPQVVYWPPQLSASGFMHAFFTNVALPGDRGKGSPWCSIAGRLEWAESVVLVGLVLCASQPNSLSQFEIERPSQWIEALRIRD